MTRLMRRMLFIAFFLASMSAAAADGYNSVEEVRLRMASRMLDPIEGIWQFTGEGAVVAIERRNSEFGLPSYSMTVIDSPQRSLLPGTPMASITSTVKSATFEAVILTHFNASSMKLSRPKKFLLILNDERLTIKPVKAKLSLNILRLIPYAYRLGLSYRDHRPDDLDGCVRIFPAPSKPIIPVHL